MTQVSVRPATAARRSQWRALRPLLILGGFVAIWWALMTGVAQAESTPQHHGLDALKKTTQSVKTHVAPVRDVVKRVHHDVKATTSKATTQVRHAVRPATKPVVRTATSVVSSTPVVKQATQDPAHHRFRHRREDPGAGAEHRRRPGRRHRRRGRHAHPRRTENPQQCKGILTRTVTPGRPPDTRPSSCSPRPLEASGHGSATAAGMHRAAPSNDGELARGRAPSAPPPSPTPALPPAGRVRALSRRSASTSRRCSWCPRSFGTTARGASRGCPADRRTSPVPRLTE